MNPEYGYGFWTNRSGSPWPYMPGDMYAMMGHCSNKCYVIPSLDLVVARTGNGPYNWHEPNLISAVLSSVIN
jgi:CubicO group peptidase (beta-lactamase class C family)